MYCKVPKHLTISIKDPPMISEEGLLSTMLEKLLPPNHIDHFASFIMRHTSMSNPQEIAKCL